MEFLVYDTTGANYSLASSTTNIALEQWYYVEAWTDKANRTAYVNVNNGTPGSATWPAGENRNGANTNALLIGARDSNGIAEYWDGLIDEVVYYKRILTADERAWIYNSGAGRTYGDLGSGTTYTYGDAAHKHAATALSSGESYTYDANGNMITRVEGGLTYTQTFDAENRLISVAVSGQTTQFIYDGNGNLVKKIKPDGSKTIYVGGIYEVDKTSGGSVTRTVTYYPVAGAMRINSTLYYILKDHLGSASVITDASGNILGENRYYPFGETRLTTGSILTDKLFTGQREVTGLGIYDYKARYYSAKLGRFLSSDSIVPGYANPQAFNRYSYVANNPLRYTDPTGHYCIDEDADGNIIRVDCDSGEPPSQPSPNPPDEDEGGGNDDDGTPDIRCHNDPDCVLGGGGHPQPMPYLNTDYYQLTASAINSGPLLPPWPFACGWFDCALSALSTIASVFTLDPATVAPAFIIDAIVTGVAFFHTQDDYHQGEISQTRQWALNGTGGLGLVPGDFGLALSFANLLMTLTGIPE